MKNFLIAILLAGGVALAALCIAQHNKIRSQAEDLAKVQSRLTSVESQLKAKSEAIEQAALSEQRARILQKTLNETSSAAVENAKQVQKLQQTLATAQTNAPGSPLASFFKDPKMKEMIKAQQKIFLGPMIDKTYAGFIQQANLSPDQAAALKDLLQKKMLSNTDSGMSLIDGSLDASQRADLSKQIKAQNDAYDQQIKQLLGDDNYEAFQTYEKSSADRMTVGQFRDQLSGSATPLDPGQEQQLIQAMTDERSRFKWTTDYRNQNPGEADYGAMFSEDRLNQLSTETEQFNQQFLARAKQILSPDQLASFEQFQEAQSKMQINALKMAGQMFAPKKP